MEENKRSYLDRAGQAWWGIGAILLSVSLAIWGGKSVKEAVKKDVPAKETPAE